MQRYCASAIDAIESWPTAISRSSASYQSGTLWAPTTVVAYFGYGIVISRRLAAKIRHRVAQHAVDHRTILARQALLEGREPAAHGLERGAHRLRRHDALDA